MIDDENVNAVITMQYNTNINIYTCFCVYKILYKISDIFFSGNEGTSISRCVIIVPTLSRK